MQTGSPDSSAASKSIEALAMCKTNAILSVVGSPPGLCSQAHSVLALSCPSCSFPTSYSSFHYRAVGGKTFSYATELSIRMHFQCGNCDNANVMDNNLSRWRGRN